MKTQQLLSALNKVKQVGRGEWIACCPAHDDKKPSLTIKETDQTVLIHCFGGCDVGEVLGAVGMDFSDLYPDTRDTVAPQKLSYAAALRAISYEALIVIASAGTMRQRQLTPDEVDRLMKASGRIQAAMDMVGL